MKNAHAKKAVQDLLMLAGIKINGDHPWDAQVHNPQLYERVVSEGSLGLGEGYMDFWWDCEALDDFFCRILKVRLDRKIKYNWDLQWAAIKASVLNLQRKSKAFDIGEHHYDIGNDLFSIMLDEGMNYSCGYWYKVDTLADAQNEKLDLICRKLGLKPGMNVLDIGCGWGGFAKYAAEKYGVNVHGITVSREQVEYACNMCNGLDVCVEYRDYRDINETYDRVVSIGMFEHVGVKNYRTYMDAVHHSLKPDGLFLLHTIGGNTTVKSCDPWILKYIFPNSMLPSAKQITEAAEGLLVLEDWHSFGQYYDNTLMAWYENFINGWDILKNTYDERFFRMWTYYLLSCAGSFRARDNQLWQIVFSKEGMQGEHHYRGSVFV